MYVIGLLRMGLLLTCALTVAFTYGVKDDVQLIQREVSGLKAQIRDEELMISDYEAEWAAKSAVPNLVRMGRKLLPDYVPLTAEHYRRFEDLPLRSGS